MTSIDIATDHKVLIIGDFQTGKSTLARVVLHSTPRFIAWDPTWTIPNGVHTLRDAAWQFGKSGMAVIHPPRGDIAGLFNETCEWALSLHDAMVFIDEPTMVMSARGSIPQGFSDLYRLGHKRGLGVTLATHRFHGDLPTLTRIVHHLFAFRTSVDVDLDALKPFIGPEGVEWVADAPDYHYWYRGLAVPGRGRPMPPLRVPWLRSTSSGGGRSTASEGAESGSGDTPAPST